MSKASLSNKALSVFQRDLLLFVTRLLTSVVVARTLGPVALGIMTVLNLVPAYAEALGRPKVDVASVYFIGQRKFKPEEILYCLNIIGLVASGLIVAGILWQFDLVLHALFGGVEQAPEWELRLLLLQVPLQFFLLNYSYLHLGHENIHVYNRMAVINALVYSIVAVGLLLLTELRLWSVIMATLMASASALGYGWLMLDRKGWSRPHWNRDLARQLLGYARHFYVAGVLGQLQETGTRTISVAFLAPAHIAFLGQAQGIGRLLHQIPAALNTILFPRISASTVGDAVAMSCKAFRVTFVLLVPSSILMAIVAEPLITAMYGSAYRTTATVLRAVLPGMAIAGVGMTLKEFFDGTGRAKLSPRILVVPVAIQLSLAWVLSQTHGLMGAAYALSAGMAVYGGLLCVVFVREGRISVAELVPRWADVQSVYGLVRQRIPGWSK